MKEKILELSPKNNTNDETIPDVKTEDFLLPKRKKRLSKSETDLVQIANETPEEISTKPICKFSLFH